MLKTSTRQTVFLPVAGLVDPETLKPGDLVGVNKDSYLILDTLPAEYDSRWGSSGGDPRRCPGAPACIPLLLLLDPPSALSSSSPPLPPHTHPPPRAISPGRVKAMEVDEKPTEDYSDIGGLDKQIQELREAIVLPITHRDRFVKLGIKPPKGVLLHGPPGGQGRGWSEGVVVFGWVCPNVAAEGQSNVASIACLVCM